LANALISHTQLQGRKNKDRSGMRGNRRGKDREIKGKAVKERGVARNTGEGRQNWERKGRMRERKRMKVRRWKEAGKDNEGGKGRK